jgi:hypothetical protein
MLYVQYTVEERHGIRRENSTLLICIEEKWITILSTRLQGKILSNIRVTSIAICATSWITGNRKGYENRASEVVVL